MRLSADMLLCGLRAGGCIRSFWRRSARLAGTPPPGLPDGFILETPGEKQDTLLSHADFSVVEKYLVCTASWNQVAGGSEFGGNTWHLQQND